MSSSFFLKSVIFFNKQQNQDFFKNKCGVVNSNSLLSVELHRYLSFPNIKFCFYNFIYFIVFQYWFIFLISITFLKGQISYQINQIAIFLVSEIITHLSHEFSFKVNPRNVLVYFNHIFSKFKRWGKGIVPFW